MLKDYPKPNVFVGMIDTDNGIVSFIEFFWEPNLVVKFIGSTILCTLYASEGPKKEIELNESKSLRAILGRYWET